MNVRNSSVRSVQMFKSSRRTSDRARKHVDDPRAVPLGTIDVDITVLAQEKRTRINKPSGRWPLYMKVDVAIALSMSSDKDNLEVATRYDRKNVGFTTIDMSRRHSKIRPCFPVAMIPKKVAKQMSKRKIKF